MSMHKQEWKHEQEMLSKVLQELRKQIGEKREFKEKFRTEAVETQRELWQEVGTVSIANELDQLVDFLGYVNLMKGQKRSHEFTRKLQEKYERMLLSPYFGRIDFVETGDVQAEAEQFYIGISNLINEDFKFMIYDWRAPICSMFYDFEIGDAYYKCPEGIIKGKLSLKRQYKIANEKIEYLFDSNLKIDDEILQEILGKSTNSKMKAIVTSIQREQNRVIRNEDFKNLIVQGPAGSGKTSVALHRIAFLLYRHREEITAENIIIFSPNQVFNDYISNVLPELGEENMHQTTFMQYMHAALNGELKLETYADMMEYILASKGMPAYEQRIRNIKYKSSLTFNDILKRYAAHVDKLDREFVDIIFNDKLIISGSEIRQLFYQDYHQLPLRRRLHKIKERILYLLKPFEKERIRELSKELEDTGDYINQMEVTEKSIRAVRNEMKELYNKIDRMTMFDLVQIYKMLFENLELFAIEDDSKTYEMDIEGIKQYTLENLKANTLYYEDQPGLLYLKLALGDHPKTQNIKFVIIDEAQDYSPMQYEILHQLFKHAGITMLGDLNQSINPFMNIGSYENISHLFPQQNTCIINLSKSYRSTVEIAKFSRKLLKKNMTEECVERRGEKPLVIGFQNEAAIQQRILKDIKSYKEQGYQSIGIITSTKQEAETVYQAMMHKTELRSILNDEDAFINDTLVIPAYLAKGLEFDVVLIYNVGDGNYGSEAERLLLYTACTRALHVLCLYYTAEPTPLLAGIS